MTCSMHVRLLPLAVVPVALALALIVPPPAAAHCDTLNGPVVQAAKVALEKGDVTPVLKWVRKEHESEIRKAFQETLAVRRQGPEARDLADRYFFETVVRIHRQGEGAPYTGLKPVGTDVGPAVAAADAALAKGSVDGLISLVAREMSEGIRERFAQAAAKQKQADTSVEAGREYVAAYVEFVHYAERLHQDAETAAGHHESASESESHARER